MPQGTKLQVTQKIRLETSILIQNQAPGLLSPRRKRIDGKIIIKINKRITEKRQW